jgi:hypothetical protein
MLARRYGLVAAVIGSLALAACDSDGVLLGDGTPLPVGSVPLPKPAPRLSAAAHFTAPQDVATWQHHPEPVSAQQFSQDKAKCTRLGNNAPGAGAPDMKFFLVFVGCMRSAGYEPGSTL